MLDRLSDERFADRSGCADGSFFRRKVFGHDALLSVEWVAHQKEAVLTSERGSYSLYYTTFEWCKRGTQVCEHCWCWHVEDPC